jgi:hypothetical protein
MQKKSNWQFHFVNWDRANEFGLLFQGARLNGRGPWKKAEELPPEVVQHMSLDEHEGNWCIDSFKTVEEFQTGAHVDKLQQCPNGVKGYCLIDVPPPVTPPRIDVDCDKLREVLRDMNEGRNLKRYGREYRGHFTCPQDKHGRYILYPSLEDIERHDKIVNLDEWMKATDHKCERCGEIHAVEWRFDDVCHGGCFDVISFDWKDADLEPSGCKGIDKILGIEGKRVVFECSGHKTFCDPCQDEESETDMSDDDWCAHEIVCDCGSDCEWTGDDWCASFHEIVRVPVVHTANVVDYEATARRMIRACEKVMAPYVQSWCDTDDALNRLYDEIQKRKGESDEDSADEEAGEEDSPEEAGTDLE